MSDPNTVDQINAAHQAVVQASSDALQHAIEAGKLLAIMFEKIKEEKHRWGGTTGWLAKNCPEISDRTDRDYRSLVKNEDKIRAHPEFGSGAAKSIRWALGLLRPKPASGSKKGGSKNKGSPGAVDAPTPPPPSKGDLYNLLPSIAPGELNAVLQDKWDRDKREELRQMLQPEDQEDQEEEGEASTEQPAAAAA
jgi:hypothetical protein